MNPIIYDLLLVALSALISWLITHRYYLKSLENQDTEYTKEKAALINALGANNETDKAILIHK
jgi:hypothetical protein